MTSNASEHLFLKAVWNILFLELNLQNYQLLGNYQGACFDREFGLTITQKNKKIKVLFNCKRHDKTKRRDEECCCHVLTLH